MTGPKPIVPLHGRYSSKEMKALYPASPDTDYRHQCSQEIRGIFSDDTKYRFWRRAWVVLAEEEQRLGLPITNEQIAALKAAEGDIDHERARALERQLKHDVMAYLKEFGEKADTVYPGASAIMHLGATSCYITDHQELDAMRMGLLHVQSRLVSLYENIDAVFSGDFLTYNDANRLIALRELGHRAGSLKARGAKGTTGTQASYLGLFNGDHGKVKELDERISRRFGFRDSYTITGQTYPRIVDYQVLGTLGLVAEVLGTMPWNSGIQPLLRHVQDCARNAANMASLQCLERTLDDSSERRIIIPEAFYAIDRAIDLSIENLGASKDSQAFPKDETVTDYTKVLSGLLLAADKTAAIIDRMHKFAEIHRNDVCAGYTHLQFAQPTTYGKRIDLWAYNFVLALEDIEDAYREIRSGMAPAVAAYLVDNRLNQAVVASAKTATDLRILQHDGEAFEPFGVSQVGSSAMPYKRNPMKAERTNGLARTKTGAIDARREMSYAFLGTDAVLDLMLSIFTDKDEKQSGFYVDTQTARARVERYMPFFVTEELLMEATKRGASRQEMHEVVRQCMMDSGGDPDEMRRLLEESEHFDFWFRERGAAALDPLNYVGRSREQVDEFGKKEVELVRMQYADKLAVTSQVNV